MSPEEFEATYPGWPFKQDLLCLARLRPNIPGQAENTQSIQLAQLGVRIDQREDGGWYEITPRAWTRLVTRVTPQGLHRMEFKEHPNAPQLLDQIEAKKKREVALAERALRSESDRAKALEAAEARGYEKALASMDSLVAQKVAEALASKEGVPLSPKPSLLDGVSSRRPSPVHPAIAAAQGEDPDDLILAGDSSPAGPPDFSVRIVASPDEDPSAPDPTDVEDIPEKPSSKKGSRKK